MSGNILSILSILVSIRIIFPKQAGSISCLGPISVPFLTHPYPFISLTVNVSRHCCKTPSHQNVPDRSIRKG